MRRREFIGAATTLALGALAHADSESAQEDTPARQFAAPRWRGFNLHPFFGSWNNGQPVEDDYRMIADLGFNFVRLPMWYTHWAQPPDYRAVRTEVLEKIDEAVELGRKYKLHTSLNFHRAPGFCIASEPKEPFNLFKDQEALDLFCFYWEMFADRYKGIPGDELSFNLVNEPVAQQDDYLRVATAAAQAIRAVSPERLIISDGLNVGRSPVPQLKELGLYQSTRGYEPSALTHYKASWVPGAENFPMPEWPVMREGEIRYGKEHLRKFYRAWAELGAEGVGVHCGECGCFNQTPHDVFLRWIGDLLDVLTEHNIGFALWEFRGAFGVLDSQRADVEYEDWHGHKLDRKLLELLLAH